MKTTDITFDTVFLYVGLTCIGLGVACIGSALLASSDIQYHCNASTTQDHPELTQNLAE